MVEENDEAIDGFDDGINLQGYVPVVVWNTK